MDTSEWFCLDRTLCIWHDSNFCLSNVVHQFMPVQMQTQVTFHVVCPMAKATCFAMCALL